MSASAAPTSKVPLPIITIEPPKLVVTVPWQQVFGHSSVLCHVYQRCDAAISGVGNQLDVVEANLLQEKSSTAIVDVMNTVCMVRQTGLQELCKLNLNIFEY